MSELVRYNAWCALGDRPQAVVLALSVISLAAAPIIYVIGSAAARREPLPPDAQRMAGAGG